MVYIHEPQNMPSAPTTAYAVPRPQGGGHVIGHSLMFVSIAGAEVLMPRRESLVGQCLVQKSWAELEMRELSVPAVIQLFDAGHMSVFVVDEAGAYLGGIGILEFEETFPQDGCLTLRDLSLPYADVDRQDKLAFAGAIAEMPLWQQKRTELAFVKDGHICAAGAINFGVIGPMGMSCSQLLAQQVLHWDLIDIEAARAYFGHRRKILLSSESGALAGFRLRFQSLLDISVYDGSRCEGDLLLYGADIWQKHDGPKISGRLLYAELLAVTLWHHLQRHGIGFCYCDIMSPVADLEKRLAPLPRWGPASPPAAWHGLTEDYLAPVDSTDDKCFHVVGGRRQDTEPLQDFEHTVYVFGVCVAMGASAYFGETIEAHLQRLLVAGGRHWRVVNCGAMGSHDQVFNDVNVLHFLLHTPLRRGDMVVLFGQRLRWRGEKLPLVYTNADVFDTSARRQGKYWWEAFLPHLNLEGYKAWAEFLAEKLVREVYPGAGGGAALVRPLSARLGLGGVRNAQLRAYLRNLQAYRHEGICGAIVMNANPFTLGHMYLMEEARKRCDYLYCFVVEEDRSAIPFADRYAIVLANCRGMKDVAVLPSGRYIISTLTFAEYFTKDSRQEQAVLPSKDVRLFGEAIAPTLGISMRFVGEEPLDGVTRQYNEAMKFMLPDYGVELVELPRLLAEAGEPINATQVRAWLHEGDMERCKSYLPQATLDYLKSKGMIE